MLARKHLQMHYVKIKSNVSRRSLLCMYSWHFRNQNVSYQNPRANKDKLQRNSCPADSLRFIPVVPERKLIPKTSSIIVEFVYLQIQDRILKLGRTVPDSAVESPKIATYLIRLKGPLVIRWTWFHADNLESFLVAVFQNGSHTRNLSLGFNKLFQTTLSKQRYLPRHLLIKIMMIFERSISR